MDKKRENWKRYYQKALARPHSPRTERAIKLDKTSLNVAIDCGCGTGRDTQFLAEHGYLVHGFDINPDSIEICANRFDKVENVQIFHNTFSEFVYMPSSLMIANASLFFVEPERFNEVWQKIVASLVKGGVFSGDLMGTKDSWAHQFHSPITALTKHQILELFVDFDIVEFDERDAEGTTAIGQVKHWHTYSVLAVKRA